MSKIEYISDPTNGGCDHDWTDGEWEQACTKCPAERSFRHRCDTPEERPPNDKWRCSECGTLWVAIVSGWRWYYEGERKDEECQCNRPFGRPDDDEWTCDECGQVWLAETLPDSWHWEDR